jgi:hypothetical protein
MATSNFDAIGVTTAMPSSLHNIMDIAVLGNPIAALTNRYVTSVNLTNVAFTLANQPDCPRNVTIQVTDTTPSINAGTITVAGFDVAGLPTLEVFTFTSTPQASWTFTGTLMHAQIVSITAAGVAVLDGAGDELITAGCGTVIGLPNPIKAASAVKHVWLGNAKVVAPVIAFGSQASGVDASAQGYLVSKPLQCSYNMSG